ncbi:hypothetical protein FRB90_009553 [Tulasnella sp. 427]|nr:hypothetical protein FRB90_009553 [Tulasnella sp. 427]
MPVTPYSGNSFTPPDVFVIPPNDDGRQTGPEPDHLSVHSTPKLSNACLPESRGFHLTQNWQYGKIRVTGFAEVKPYYISKELNTLGGCWATPEKHEALCVKVKLGDCRNLYLENTPELHVKLGLTWDSINRHAPNLHRGSTDRANLVFLEEDGSSSARVFCGQTKDGIFTIGRDNLVKISLPDDTRKERKLHVVVKAESRLKWPGRISLVADDDAFTTRHHGYIRSELIFEPYN